MISVLNVLLGVALAATAIVLLTGIYSMARGGEFNRKYGNLLMRWRVALQGCALLLLVLVMLFSGRW
jgi:Hypoxia induced protein conserved region